MKVQIAEFRLQIAKPDLNNLKSEIQICNQKSEI